MRRAASGRSKTIVACRYALRWRHDEADDLIEELIRQASHRNN